MKNSYRQNGIGLINLIVIVLVVGFIASFAIRVVPMYADNRLIVSGLKSLTEPGNNLSQMSDAEIRKKMGNFYMINNVNVEGAKKIVIDRTKSDSLIVKIDYENRANLFSNIDLVMTFENHLDSSRPTECCVPLDKTSVKH